MASRYTPRQQQQQPAPYGFGSAHISPGWGDGTPAAALGAVASSVAQVQFTSAPNKLASATAAGITNVTQVAADDGSGKGLAVYQIDLTQ